MIRVRRMSTVSPGKRCRVSAAGQHRIRDKRKRVTQGKEQRLRSRHLERRGIAREKLLFEDAGLVRAHRLAKRIGHGAFEASVILHRNQVRMVLSEPRQHAGVHLAVEVIHHERAEDGDLVLVGELVELILKVHAGSHVSSLPEHVHHLAPPANLRVAPAAARLRDDIRGQAKEHRRIRHGVTHELRQKLVGIDDRELPTTLARPRYPRLRPPGEGGTPPNGRPSARG